MNSGHRDDPTDPFLHLAEKLSAAEAKRPEWQRRARAWIKTDSFRNLYAIHHPRLRLVLRVWFLRTFRSWRIHRPSLWRQYQKLSTEGELMLGAVVIGNNSIKSEPHLPLPAAVLVPEVQTADGLLRAALFSVDLADAYVMGHTHLPPCTELIRADEYRPLRRRKLPSEETADVALHLFDSRVRGVDAHASPVEPFVPLLVGRGGKVFITVLWHACPGQPAPPRSGSLHR